MLETQRFSHKILLMPLLAAAAFVSILLTTRYVGAHNERLMTEIEQGYSEGAEFSRDLEEGLIRLQRGLQDAVAAEEIAAVTEVDVLAAELMTRLEEAKKIRTLDRDELRKLSADLQNYYSLARSASERMIRHEASEQLQIDLEQMRQDYNSLRVRLRIFSVRQRQLMASGFEDARRKHAAALRVIIIITVIGLALLGLISWFVIRLMSRQLRQAVEIADQLASGDVERRVEVTSRDEIGQLLVRMNEMVDRVQDRTRQLTIEVAERHRAEDAHRVSEERYALAAAGANDGLWDWDLERNEIYFSSRWGEMLGLDAIEIGSAPEVWFKLVDRRDIGILRGHIDAHLHGATMHFEHEYRIRHRDGSIRWMLARGLAVRNSEGVPYRLAGSQTDITDRKRAEEQLTRDAFYDGLTGLPNRALFMDRLEHAIKTARRRDATTCAVLFLDLDRFKFINDSLGHLAGDELLVELARRIEKTLRAGDTAARLGGDEFVILAESVENVADATAIAGRVFEEMRRPFTLREGDVFMTVSIGIALGGPQYERPEDLLRDADIAMYRAKEAGKARHEVFDRSMHTRMVEMVTLETDLRRAVAEDEFFLEYQPIVSLSTGGIRGFEALVRWQHPERGRVPPDQFIGLAEETGLIIPIGRWVVGEACRQARVWNTTFDRREPFVVSVNLSPKQFLDPVLLEHITRILRETELPAGVLRLEITESVIMTNADAAILLLEQLRELDVPIDIDDFGTGYSSLSYLHRFPINTLKIDQSFVSGARREDGWQIVATIVALAHNLGLNVIAEGVETEDQVKRLKALRCDLAQGWFFSAPLGPADVESWLRGTPSRTALAPMVQIGRD